VEYVMVPVPEELAPKVLTYVRWKGAEPSAAQPAGESPGAGDHDESLARAFARLDGASRSLVAVAAAAALEAEELTIPQAAERAGVTTREALGILFEVNNVITSEGGPPLVFSGKDVGGAEPGEFTWDTHVVMVPAAIAEPIVRLGRGDISG
jgi:hypothetical protein